MSLEESSECLLHGSGSLAPRRSEAGRGGGQGGQRAHHLCRPLCWQPSSPCIAVIQRLVLGVQMSFQMPSAPLTKKQ